MKLRHTVVAVALALVDGCAPAPCTQTSCPLDEVCDADGRCVKSETPPGEGEGEGVSSEGEGEGQPFDCSFGAFDPAAAYVVAPLLVRSVDNNAIGVAPIDALGTMEWQIDPSATSFHVRPSDGALLYASQSDQRIHVFVPDPLSCPFVDHTVDGVANDPLVHVCGDEPLPDLRFFIAHDTNLVVANCGTTSSPRYEDETGVVIYQPTDASDFLIAVGHNGVLLVADTPVNKMALDDGGTITDVTGFALGVSVIGGIPNTRTTATGFSVVVFDVNGFELFSIDATNATATSGGAYPIGTAPGPTAALDGAGRVAAVDVNDRKAPILRATPGGKTLETIVVDPASGDIHVDSLSVVFSGP